MKKYYSYPNRYDKDGQRIVVVNKNIGETIKLNPVEQKDVKTFVDWRMSEAVLKKAKDKLVTTDDERRKELKRNGAGAEMAFAKHFGGIGKLGLRDKNWDEDKGDVKLWGGTMVDVKLNSLNNHWAANHLLITVNCFEKATVPLFALMTGEFPEYRFGGFCPRVEVESRSYKTAKTFDKDGYPVNFHIDPSDLSDWSQLDWTVL